MSSFDAVARQWDDNPAHWERSQAVASYLRKMIPLNKTMTALEFGAGTGILSFLLRNEFASILMMDSSIEMVNVMKEKIITYKTTNLTPIHFDLEQNDYYNNPFNLIMTQMTLHHISNINSITDKFYRLLFPGGYLAIADLYKEDGSFHSEGFTGHNGFDINDLKQMLLNKSFRNIRHQTCYIRKKETGNGEIKEFPIFLLVAET